MSWVVEALQVKAVLPLAPRKFSQMLTDLVGATLNLAAFHYSCLHSNSPESPESKVNMSKLTTWSCQLCASLPCHQRWNAPSSCWAQKKFSVTCFLLICCVCVSDLCRCSYIGICGGSVCVSDLCRRSYIGVGR